MRLLLAAFCVLVIYQCANSPKENKMDVEMRGYLEIDSYNGKVIKYIKAGEYNDLFIYFTDGDSMHLSSWSYPIHWLKP